VCVCVCDSVREKEREREREPESKRLRKVGIAETALPCEYRRFSFRSKFATN